MEAFQSRGLKPLDILRSATCLAARHYLRDGAGTIAAGRRADLVALDADPLEDIANVARIRSVLEDGQAHESAKLLALA